MYKCLPGRQILYIPHASLADVCKMAMNYSNSNVQFPSRWLVSHKVHLLPGLCL